MHIAKKDCQKLNDKELVERSLRDIDYFACIYERYEQKLIWYILRISSFSPEKAEDILQEAFIKAWKNLNEFDRGLKFSSWIYRIVHNTTITEWKKSQSKGKNRKQNIDEEVFRNIPSSLNIEKEASQKFDKENIQRILQLMPEKYREVLILKFLEEKDYKEISDILKKPSGTVATLVSRGKKSFYQTAKQNNISFTL